ncbi:MAG TPA: endonuclease/exonuclease/phosphatase family protein [Bacteroidales bacterium]|nr:endonuclease/exonuclease/phosphatase family protein [Bacteroidales bacterium]
MAEFFRIVLMILIWIIATVLTIAFFFLLFSMITEYKPEPEELLQTKGNSADEKISDSILTLMTWNTGYACMGAEANFFYDGGTMMRPEKVLHEKYLRNIQNTIKSESAADFILLQEIDKKARRSYFSNQTEVLIKTLSGHNAVFAVNYDVMFVPVPFSNPMGKVLAGLMSFSKYEPKTSNRISFSKNYPWPLRLFNLKRCFILQRFQLNNGFELVILNTHNSAFDDGYLRISQISELRSIAITEYDKGNYVIIGGDWNINPPGFDPNQISNGDLAVKKDIGSIPEDFMPVGWKWVFDPKIPTNRYVDTAYRKKQTPTTIIDFFLVSPNIQLISSATSDLQFSNSDHNPLIIKIKMIN